MRSLCIVDGILYYSSTSIGTLMVYLNHLLDKEVKDICDQGRVQPVEDKFFVFGDKSIEKNLSLVKEVLQCNDVYFKGSSDKNFNPDIKRIVNVLIAEDMYDYTPKMMRCSYEKENY